MKRTLFLACLVALALAACDRKQPPSAAGTSQDLAPDGTLVNPEARVVREPDPPSTIPARPASASAASVISAAEQAVRDAGKALHTPDSGYDEEVTAIVNGFPAYAPTDSLQGGPIRIVGSDSMGPMLDMVGSRFQGMYPSVPVDVRQGGSARGLAALLKGECEFAAISDDPTPEQVKAIEAATKKRVFIAPIAVDGVCMFVNRDNPIRSLTKAQCNGILAITHSMAPNPILRWNELDPASPLGSEFLPLYVLERGSGTMQAMIRWCMPGERVTTILCYEEPSPGSVVNACCAYPLAIGVSGFGARQPRARAVPLDDGRGPVEPTVATIRDRTYPVVRNLSLAFVAADEASIPPRLVEFLQYAWSTDGQDAVATLRVVPPTLDMMPAFIGTPTDGCWK
jgi:phosphate transport system substrate-binding protein